MPTPDRDQRLLDLLQECADAELAVARWQAECRPTSEVEEGVKLDDDRRKRCGFHEVVFAQGKTPAMLASIFAKFQEQGLPAFATRVSPEQAALIQREFPTVIYNSTAHTLRIPAERKAPDVQQEQEVGYVPVVAAGTSDLPVAEEALETLRWMSCDCRLIADVGVAGPQRLIQSLQLLKGSDAIVVVAGMEGALPSVVGGWVDCPVFAVPTSVGYGASFGGVSALLTMLNSCASNVAVVNIDAGFKAGYMAGLVAHRVHRER